MPAHMPKKIAKIAVKKIRGRLKLSLNTAFKPHKQGQEGMVHVVRFSVCNECASTHPKKNCGKKKYAISPRLNTAFKPHKQGQEGMVHVVRFMARNIPGGECPSSGRFSREFIVEFPVTRPRSAWDGIVTVRHTHTNTTYTHAIHAYIRMCV